MHALTGDPQPLSLGDGNTAVCTSFQLELLVMSSFAFYPFSIAAVSDLYAVEKFCMRVYSSNKGCENKYDHVMM